jgi:hypothetical protein
MIPKRLIRTVPEHTTDEVEQFWSDACALHPDWEHVTLRDPVNRDNFPLTRHLWDTCESGAQLADLIRAEELYWRGGVYIDSDVEVYRSFEPLLHLQGFAGWDCIDYIPNAIMGFEPLHEASYLTLALACDRHVLGTWQAGVGVTTEVFRGRNDMALFPPGSFYPVFWRDRDATDWSTVRAENPWAYCCHRAHHSWKDAGK